MNRRRRFKAKRVRRFRKLDRIAYSIYCSLNDDFSIGKERTKAEVKYFRYLNKLYDHRAHIGLERVNRY